MSQHLTSDEWKRQAQIATVMSLLDDVNHHVDVASASSATGLAPTPTTELLGEMVKRGFLRPSPGCKWERGYVTGKLDANRFERRPGSAQQEVHKAMQMYVDEGEIITAWVVVAEVADADGKKLMHRFGGGQEGTNAPTVWEAIGMLRSGEAVAERQLADTTRDV